MLYDFDLFCFFIKRKRNININRVHVCQECAKTSGHL